MIQYYLTSHWKNKMFLNPEGIPVKKYKCNEHVMKYLFYTCKLSILGISGGLYYFRDNESLQECIKAMPLLTRIMGKL